MIEVTDKKLALDTVLEVLSMAEFFAKQIPEPTLWKSRKLNEACVATCQKACEKLAQETLSWTDVFDLLLRQLNYLPEKELLEICHRIGVGVAYSRYCDDYKELLRTRIRNKLR